MRYFRYSTPENKVTFYPLVCWHVGAAQADYEFIDEMIYRVKEDPHGKAIYLGDGGECVTKTSKGMIYEQTMSPQEQLNYLRARLAPIKSKLLFGVKGNHGWRTFKDTGLGFDESLMLSLGVPYHGTATFWNLAVNRSTYDIFTHHGLDSGVAIGTKINKAKKFEEIVIADAILSAHSHICAVIPPHTRAYLNNGKSGGIRWLDTTGYICGCAYDSRTGYAEDKGYPPILPAHIAITFHGTINGGTPAKRQSHEIIRADANKARQPNREDVVYRMSSGEVRCSRHPEYKGTRKPQGSCDECWRLYIRSHP